MSDIVDINLALRRARLAAARARPRPMPAPCARSTGALRIEKYFEPTHERRTGMVPLPVEFAPPPEVVDEEVAPLAPRFDAVAARAVVELGAPPTLPARVRRGALALGFCLASVGLGVTLGALL